MQHREFHTRAADEVRDDFKRQNRDLLQGQGLQFSASSRQRTRELRPPSSPGRERSVRAAGGYRPAIWNAWRSTGFAPFSPTPERSSMPSTMIRTVVQGGAN